MAIQFESSIDVDGRAIIGTNNSVSTFTGLTIIGDDIDAATNTIVDSNTSVILGDGSNDRYGNVAITDRTLRLGRADIITATSTNTTGILNFNDSVYANAAYSNVGGIVGYFPPPNTTNDYYFFNALSENVDGNVFQTGASPTASRYNMSTSPTLNGIGQKFDANTTNGGAMYITGSNNSSTASSRGIFTFDARHQNQNSTVPNGHSLFEVTSGYGNTKFLIKQVSGSTNVGIGTTNPNYKLEVNGTLGVSRTDGIIFAGSLGTGTGNKITSDTSNNFIFSTALGSAPYTLSERMRIDNNGNVGIGTTSPNTALEVDGAISTTTSDYVQGSTGSRLLLETPGSGNTHSYIQAQNAGGTTNTEDLALQFYGGNVGIGTDSPSQKLDVSGNIKMTETAATTDTDKFVVSDSGVLKYRTGAQVRSDIGAGTGNGSVTSIATQNGITGGTITSTGTLEVDSTVVRTSGAQTIAGEKTFTNQLAIDTAAGSERMRLFNENNTAPIADSFSGNTSKSYIYFDTVSGSNDPGYIMHESSATETNEGVLHLVPTDDNATGDYVSIHGTNDVDVLKLHTSGLIETANLQLQIKSGLGAVYVNDDLVVETDLTVSGGDITLGGTGRIQGVDTVSAGTDAANKTYVDNAVSGFVDGSGTTNYIPKWSNSSTLTDSGIVETSTLTTINNASFEYDYSGTTYLNVNGSQGTFLLGQHSTTNRVYIHGIQTHLRFYTNNVKAGEFDSNQNFLLYGNVGINATNPTEKLVVSGNTSVTNNVYIGFGNTLKACTYSAQYSLAVGVSNSLGGIANGIIGVSNTIDCATEPWLSLGGNFIAGLNNEIIGGYSHANAILGQLNTIGSSTINVANSLVAGSEHIMEGANGLMYGYNCQGLSSNSNYSLTGGYESQNFSGFGSVAIGAGATASTGNNQYAFGTGVTTPTSASAAYGDSQFVVGKYNEYTNGSFVAHRFAVGNGSSDASRDTPFCVIGSGTYTNGQVSINDADGFAYSSAPYSILHVNGRATSSYSSAFTVTSDERVKKNIVDYSKGLAEIIQVQPKSYSFNGKANTIEDVESIGVLAQEIKEVFPETVGTVNKRLNPEDEQETELYTVDISPVTYALINAVKELNAKVEALETRIQTLEGN